MKWVFRVIGVLLISALPGIAAAAAALDLLQAASNNTDLQQFVEAVKAAGMDRQLATGGPYTVFAPTDEAFRNMPADRRDEIFHDKAKLAALISYHIIPGKVLVTEVKPGSTATLEGAPVELKSDNGMVSVNRASVTQSDIKADNGVIHTIDRVLTPPDTSMQTSRH